MTNSKLIYLILVLVLSGMIRVSSSQEEIEEITVTGPKSINTLKFEMNRAQDETFSVFNASIDDPNFEITCRMERPFKDGFDPIPVHREVRVCLTGYVYQERQRANQDYMDGFSDGEIVGLTAHQMELEQKMNDLVENNTEFSKRQCPRYVLLKREYDKAREEEMSTSLFSRLFGSKDSQ